MKTIVFTGGHHNSALEVAKALQAKNYQIVWFGHKHTMRGENALSFEYQEVSEANIKFYELKAGKFYNPAHYSEWLKIPRGFWQSWRLLREVRPKLIVSFGSYLSSPVVLAGYLLGIPSVCHEQTTKTGWANRFNAVFAKKIFLTWPESYQWFPQHKTIYTGLPLRRTTVFQKNLCLVTKFNNKLPTIFITGGKQGSHIINQTLMKAYPALLPKYNIIHQTGGSKKTNDYAVLMRAKKRLPAYLQKKLFLRKYFFQKQMCEALRQADLVIGRAGAHSVYELIALAKPALFIPLKLSLTKEQLANAQKAKSLGMAEIIMEENLDVKGLVAKIEEIVKNIKDYQRNGQKAKKMIKRNATSTIVEEIEKLL